MAPQPVSAATAAGMPAIAKYSSTDIFVMEGKSKHLLLKEVCLVYKLNNAMNGSREIESVYNVRLINVKSENNQVLP